MLFDILRRLVRSMVLSAVSKNVFACPSSIQIHIDIASLLDRGFDISRQEPHPPFKENLSPRQKSGDPFEGDPTARLVPMDTADSHERRAIGLSHEMTD